MSLSLFADERTVLDFHDTVLVNDTQFTLGEIAEITGNDTVLIEQLKTTVAGMCTPPSYSRSITVNDFLIRLRTRFKSAVLSIRGSSHPIIKTDSREISLSMYEANINDYLDSAIGWKQGEWHVDLRNISETVSILNAPLTVTISGLETKRYPKGTTALVMNICQGTRMYRMVVQCFITVTCPVVMALRPIERGQIVSSDDVEMRTVDITRFAPVPITECEELAGKRAARSIQQGTILHARLFQPIPVIEKNDPVMIVHQDKGVAISITGTAREQGGTGKRIWVENQTTHKLLRAIVIDKGKVALATGDVTL